MLAQFTKALHQIWGFFSKWWVWIALAWFVVSYVFLRIRGSGNEVAALVPAFLGVIFGLIALITVIYQKVEALHNIATSKEPTLLSLFQCYEDFGARLVKVSERQPLKINHLGLSMTEAWNYVYQTVNAHPRAMAIEIRLLILPEDPNLIPGAPPEVRDWCLQVPGAKEQLRNMLSVNDDWLRQQGKNVRLELREYHQVPTMHGFYLELPEPARVMYVSFCRWAGANYSLYDWGGRAYRTIVGDSSDPSQADLAEMFRGEFEHLWGAAGQTLYQYPEQPATDPVSSGRGGAPARNHVA